MKNLTAWIVTVSVFCVVGSASAQGPTLRFSEEQRRCFSSGGTEWHDGDQGPPHCVCPEGMVNALAPDARCDDPGDYCIPGDPAPSAAASPPPAAAPHRERPAARPRPAPAPPTNRGSIVIDPASATARPGSEIAVRVEARGVRGFSRMTLVVSGSADCLVREAAGGLASAMRTVYLASVALLVYGGEVGDCQLRALATGSASDTPRADGSYRFEGDPTGGPRPREESAEEPDAAPLAEAPSPGAPGVNCWDLDGDRENDADEDVNGDGSWNAQDCQGREGPQGPEGPAGGRGPQGAAGEASETSWTDNFHLGLVLGGAFIDGERSALVFDPGVSLSLDLADDILELYLVGGPSFSGDDDRPWGGHAAAELRGWFWKYVGVAGGAHLHTIATDAHGDNEAVEFGGQLGPEFRLRSRHGELRLGLRFLLGGQITSDPSDRRSLGGSAGLGWRF